MVGLPRLTGRPSLVSCQFYKGCAVRREKKRGEFKLKLLQKFLFFPDVGWSKPGIFNHFAGCGFSAKSITSIWLVILACSLPAQGDSIALIPSADTTIMEITPTNNAGGRSWINVGGNHYGLRNRALMKFDIAGNIPAHSQIISASLNLNVVGVPEDGYDVCFFDLHRVLRNWVKAIRIPALPRVRARQRQRMKPRGSVH